MLLLCLSLCFTSLLPLLSMFPHIHLSLIFEFLAITFTTKTGLLRCCLYGLGALNHLGPRVFIVCLQYSTVGTGLSSSRAAFQKFQRFSPQSATVGILSHLLQPEVTMGCWSGGAAARRPAAPAWAQQERSRAHTWRTPLAAETSPTLQTSTRWQQVGITPLAFSLEVV